MIIGITPVLLLGGCLLMDQISMASARPPKTIKTIEDFRTWKGGSNIREGTFENSGVKYTVMLAPAGRYLASGPSAYMFNEQGQFVDWTPDTGDSYTVKNRFDLASGHVRNITRNRP